MATAPDEKILEVLTVDELRDELPTSGVFDMVDCTLEIACLGLIKAP